MANDQIEVGGPYKESDDHVPNPTDMVAQFNTEGVGAHNRIEEVSPIFEVDKQQTAAEIVAALDPEDSSVPSSRVLLPEGGDDPKEAKESLLNAAKGRLEQGPVVIGGPTPAEAEAEESGEEGKKAAVEQEASNASQNSVGGADAGQHDDAAGDKAEAKKAPAKKAASSQK